MLEVLPVPEPALQDPAVPDPESPRERPPEVGGCSDRPAGGGGPTAAARTGERDQDGGETTGSAWSAVYLSGTNQVKLLKTIRTENNHLLIISE